MTRLIDELDTLHASYVDAINHAIAADDVALAAEMAAEYDRDALLLAADHEGHPDPVIGIRRDGRDSPLRRVAARLATLRAA